MDNRAEVLDVDSAASILFSMRHARLNRETAIELEAMKRDIREKARPNTPSSSLDVNQRKRKSELVLGRHQDKPNSLERAIKGMIGGCNNATLQKLLKLTEYMNANQLKQYVGYAPPKLPPFVAIDIDECSKPCQKALTLTDLEEHQLRLSLNKNHVIEFMLPMLNEGENISEGIDVTTYDEFENQYNMKFKVWGRNKMFVLTTKGWQDFYQHHQLKEYDVVAVWMFPRHDTQQLCFAISCRKVPPEVRSQLPSSSTSRS